MFYDKQRPTSSEKKAESRSVIFCNNINAFKKKIFVNFVSFLLTLECGYGKINDM